MTSLKQPAPTTQQPEKPTDLSNSGPLPKEVYTRSSPIEKDFRIKYKNEDSRFGNITVIEVGRENQIIAARERVTNSKQEHTQNIKETMFRLKINHPFLLTLHDFSTGTKSGFCSTFHRLREYWDHNLDDLMRETMNRVSRGQSYSDKELTYMASNLTKALSHLHDHGRLHKDVSPAYVDVGAIDSCNYRLMEPVEQKSSFEEICSINFRNGKDIYAAPEVFNRAMQKKKKSKDKKSEILSDNEIIPQKADAFSLGMTILKAGVGESVQDCYPMQTSIFDHDALKRHYQNFVARFGDNRMLVDSVERLLDPNPETRWEPRELRGELPDQEEIDDFYNSENYLENKQRLSIKTTPIKETKNNNKTFGSKIPKKTDNENQDEEESDPKKSDRSQSKKKKRKGKLSDKRAGKKSTRKSGKRKTNKLHYQYEEDIRGETPEPVRFVPNAGHKFYKPLFTTQDINDMKNRVHPQVRGPNREPQRQPVRIPPRNIPGPIFKPQKQRLTPNSVGNVQRVLNRAPSQPVLSQNQYLRPVSAIPPGGAVNQPQIINRRSLVPNQLRSSYNVRPSPIGQSIHFQTSRNEGATINRTAQFNSNYNSSQTNLANNFVGSTVIRRSYNSGTGPNRASRLVTRNSPSIKDVQTGQRDGVTRIYQNKENQLERKILLTLEKKTEIRNH